MTAIPKLKPVSVFDPARFDVTNLDQAKRIILTDEDSSTDRRWETETPYLMGLMKECGFSLGPRSVVLDYGCGVGRLARELITEYGCSVIGVDTSASMRALAAAYVDSDKFMACAPSLLAELNSRWMLCDAAIVVWTLQHILDPAESIALIRAYVRGLVLVVNNKGRALPVAGERPWADDGIDIWSLLKKAFKERAHGALDPACTTPLLARHAQWGLYESGL